MKVYHGRRTPAGVEVRVENDDGLHLRMLDPRFDLRNHSPTGFEYGYCGSGPAQLALAMLADALGDDEQAMNWYQEFKRVVIASLNDPEWTLTEEQVIYHLDMIRAHVR